MSGDPRCRRSPRRRQRWLRRYGLPAFGGAVVIAVWAAGRVAGAAGDALRPELRRRRRAGCSRPPPPHWLGTDALGRDVLTRVIYGARVSLSVGFTVVLLGALFGTLLGAVAAYARGWAEEALMRVTDLVFCFPPIILAMAIAAALGIGTVNTVHRHAGGVVAEIRPPRAQPGDRRSATWNMSRPRSRSASARRTSCCARSCPTPSAR